MAEETNMQSSNESKPNSDKTKTDANIISESQPTVVAQKQPTDDINHCCRDCIRWDKYGEKCFYWWKGKRYCSRRVTSMEELEHENLFLG